MNVLLLTFVSIYTVIAANNFNLTNNIQGVTQKPLLLHNLPHTKIDDVDYWDDDFVPYKSDRHDTFDWRLLKTALLKDSDNIIMSPFSVKLLLVLLSEAAGAETDTQRELSSVFPDLKSVAIIRELYKKYLESLQEQDNNYDLKIGTKIYVDHYIEPRQRYAAIVSSHYGARIENLDFRKTQAAVSVINNWCKNITNGFLENVVSPDDLQNAVMLMLNAIYFDGNWRRPFLPNNTIEQPFFVSPSVQLRTNFMTLTSEFYFLESTKLNAKIIRLPYKGRKFSMTIIVPNAKGGLNELIRELDSDTLKRLQWLMGNSVVKVTLPKFKFDYTSHLKDVLQSLGIMEIFTQNASLPGLSRGAALSNQLRVSDIIQKSGLIVNEKGTTAYATTEVIISNKFGGNTVAEFNANRPFMFLIEDESTGAILFAGKVIDPTK